MLLKLAEISPAQQVINKIIFKNIGCYLDFYSKLLSGMLTFLVFAKFWCKWYILLSRNNYMAISECQVIERFWGKRKWFDSKYLPVLILSLLLWFFKIRSFTCLCYLEYTFLPIIVINYLQCFSTDNCGLLDDY